MILIIEVDTIDTVVGIHEKIFGESFPYENYRRKKMTNKLYVYGYYRDGLLIGYSIVIDQKDEKNLYAWYGGVLPEFQGNGITVDFFNILVKKAESIGYSSISLATTNCRPNMLRLAIKYGFDIYDIKKREDGEGNKIYFKFCVFPQMTLEICLADVETPKVRVSDLEKQLVYAYKHNCKKIIFWGVHTLEQQEIVTYVKRYCKNFLRKIQFEVHECLKEEEQV